MWSLETIRAINQDATHEAEQRAKEPYTMRAEEEVIRWPPFPFPHLGYIDTGHEKVSTLFCDSSGFGAPNEPGLTVDQLKEELVRLFRENGPLEIYIKEVGQFQLILAVEVRASEK